MKALARWAMRSNEVAIANARWASTECSRRRVEREDVGLFLASLDLGTPAQRIEGADSLSG